MGCTRRHFEEDLRVCGGGGRRVEHSKMAKDIPVTYFNYKGEMLLPSNTTASPLLSSGGGDTMSLLAEV